MHFVTVWIMNYTEMIVHLFFSAKNLPALSTHVLPRPDFRSVLGLIIWVNVSLLKMKEEKEV